MMARSGLCWRCHYHDRQEAVKKALEEKLWTNEGAGDGTAKRKEMLEKPPDPKAILKEVVRPAGVLGANAGHAAQAMSQDRRILD